MTVRTLGAGLQQVVMPRLPHERRFKEAWLKSSCLIVAPYLGTLCLWRSGGSGRGAPQHLSFLGLLWPGRPAVKDSTAFLFDRGWQAGGSSDVDVGLCVPKYAFW